MVTGSPAIANDLAARYDRDGYLLVPSVLSDQECRELKSEGLKVLREHAKPNSSVYVGVAVASPMFYKLASDARIIDILRQIMPEGVMFMSDKFVLKSGTQRFATPWHCDVAYWRNTRPKLSVWIPLDDASVQNGTLKVFPGGHKHEWQHHSAARDTPSGEFTFQLPQLAASVPEEVICEIPAGSLVIFSDRLPHSSTPNTAGQDRYAIIGTYHAPAEDEAFDLGFAARHAIVPAPVI